MELTELCVEGTILNGGSPRSTIEGSGSMCFEAYTSLYLGLPYPKSGLHLFLFFVIFF